MFNSTGVSVVIGLCGEGEALSFFGGESSLSFLLHNLRFLEGLLAQARGSYWQQQVRDAL